MCLQLLLLVHGNWRERAVPVLAQSLIAADPIGKQANGKGVFVGVVITLQDKEVLRHQEGRPLTAIRHLQRSLFARIRESASVGAYQTNLLPLGDRKRTRRELAPLRQDNLIAPGTAWLPAIAMQEICGCTKRIGNRVPNVALAVTIDVDGIGLLTGGDKLRVAERASPRAGKMTSINVAGLE